MTLPLNIRTFFTSIIVLVSPLCLPLCLPLYTANAQDANTAGGAMTVVIKGTLKATNGKILQVTQEDGDDIYVQLPAAPNALNYEAELTPQQIQRGMSARFTSSVDAMTNGPIVGKNVELFTPEEAKNYDLKNRSVMVRYVTGIYPASMLTGDPNAADVYVVGPIVGYKNNALIINAGQTISVQMPEDAKLRFKTMSMQFAKIGDEVVGGGISYNPQSRQVVASNLTIVGKVAVAKESAAAVVDLADQTPKSKRRMTRKEKLEAKKQMDEAAETPTVK